MNTDITKDATRAASNAGALDLYATEELALEELPAGNALGSFFSLTTAGSASCPATSASSLTTASSFS